MHRLLITTALEDTWRDDVPVLFLGEWCRRYSRRSRWSTMDAEVLPYHWDDREKLRADFHYLQQLHERLLKDLAAHLNDIHRVDHSLRYWRIIVGPWLGYFIQILFDRWTCIQQAIREYEPSATIVLAGGDTSGVAHDMWEFTHLLHTDEWNHRLYAAILTQFTGVVCIGDPARQLPAGPVAPSRHGTAGGRWTPASIYDSIVAPLSRDRDVFVRSTSLEWAAEMRLQLRLGQVPRRWRAVLAPKVAVDLSRRQWVVAGDAGSEFERCARALIPAHLPATYLEGRRALSETVSRLPWPRRPAAIWTAYAAHDDVFQAWAAEKIERGAALVISQHGGHYGVGAWSFVEDHELAVSDRYLSWGWSDAERGHVTPVGWVSAKRPCGVRHGSQPAALLVTVSMPRYSYWMYSVIVARQWLDYFEDQRAFVRSLPAQIRRALIVRLYKPDYGWDQQARWTDAFPDVRVDPGVSRIDDLIRQSRLYISTYNATTFLESIAMQVPTVIHWNPRHWEVRDSAVPYFDDLRRVGILHQTPKQAAAHVSRIWDDVDAWWGSPEVVDVRSRFAAQYCRTPKDALERVASVLRTVSTAEGTFRRANPVRSGRPTA